MGVSQPEPMLGATDQSLELEDACRRHLGGCGISARQLGARTVADTRGTRFRFPYLEECEGQRL